MARRKIEQEVEFICTSEEEGACEAPETWLVSGRFNAEGNFEPDDEVNLSCPECSGDAEPNDPAVDVEL